MTSKGCAEICAFFDGMTFSIWAQLWEIRYTVPNDDFDVDYLLNSAMSAILGDDLYYAALFGFLTVARSLLTRDVDPNHFGSYFRYPLRAAMITDNHDMFNLLLESDVNVKIKRGFDGVLLFDALAKG